MTDPDRIKLTAARRIWPVRDEVTPSKSGTWAEWWSKRFGRDYMEYVRERMANGGKGDSD